jgi:hypothetical protein
LQRWAATGAKTSRPANVAPGAGRWFDGAIGAADDRHGRGEEAVVGADEDAGAAGHLDRQCPARRPDAGVDDGEHDAFGHVGDGAGEGQRAASNVERPHTVGQVDDRDVRGHVAQHGLDDADELVLEAVVGEERHGVVRAAHAGEPTPGRDEGRCQPPDGTSPVGAARTSSQRVSTAVTIGRDSA